MAALDIFSSTINCNISNASHTLGFLLTIMIKLPDFNHKARSFKIASVLYNHHGNGFMILCLLFAPFASSDSDTRSCLLSQYCPFQTVLSMAFCLHVTRSLIWHLFSKDYAVSSCSTSSLFSRNYHTQSSFC